jgi:hypothetical protein
MSASTIGGWYASIDAGDIALWWVIAFFVVSAVWTLWIVFGKNRHDAATVIEDTPLSHIVRGAEETDDYFTKGSHWSTLDWTPEVISIKGFIEENDICYNKILRLKQYRQKFWFADYDSYILKHLERLPVGSEICIRYTESVDPSDSCCYVGGFNLELPGV